MMQSVAHTILPELVVGSPLRIDRSYQLVHGGLLEKAWFAVKRDNTEDDTEALISISVTPTTAAQGRITDPGGGGVAQFYFQLSAIDSGKLAPRARYQAEITVKVVGGAVSEDPTVIESCLLKTHYRVQKNPV